MRVHRAARRRARLGATALLAAVAVLSLVLSGGPAHAVGASPRTSTAAHAGRRTAAQIHGPLRFGVDYTPSKDWWYLWDHWDPGSVAGDLAAIHDLGVDHIRIQLPWDMFQPKSAHQVDANKLNELQRLMSIAAANRLDVVVSVLATHISGKNFVPKQWAKGNYVTDPKVVAGELYLFRAVGQRIGHDANLIGFDLGNELLGIAPKHEEPVLNRWVHRLMTAADTWAPGKLNTVSSFGGGPPPYPMTAATVGAVSVVHAWWFMPAVDGNGALLPQASQNAAAEVRYMQSFATPSRPVWVQELGAPQVDFNGDVDVPPALAADYLEQQVRSIAALPGVYGITWWDSFDLPKAYAKKFGAPERTLGLFTSSRVAKPDAYRLAALIAEYHRNGHL